MLQNLSIEEELQFNGQLEALPSPEGRILPTTYCQRDSKWLP